MGVAIGGAVLVGLALLYIVGKLTDRFASASELADDISRIAIGQVVDTHLARSDGQLRPEALSAQRFEFLECFRSIRSVLLFMNKNGYSPKTLLVGSSVPLGGQVHSCASSVCDNGSLADRTPSRIDSDMRRSRLHRHFGVGKGPGLADLLPEEARAQETIVPSSVKISWIFCPPGRQRRAGRASLRPGILRTPQRAGLPSPPHRQRPISAPRAADHDWCTSGSSMLRFVRRARADSRPFGGSVSAHRPTPAPRS